MIKWEEVGVISSNALIDGTPDDQVWQVIRAIRGSEAAGASEPAVIIACARVLAKHIDNAPVDVYRSVYALVHALIDGFTDHADDA
jgi:hypothetical protein